MAYRNQNYMTNRKIKELVDKNQKGYVDPNQQQDNNQQQQNDNQQQQNDNQQQQNDNQQQQNDNQEQNTTITGGGENPQNTPGTPPDIPGMGEVNGETPAPMEEEEEEP